MLTIYNTLTKNKEVFKPIKDGCVSFYQCGPTVYWTQHIGNLRAAVLSDIIRRTFLYLGYQVKFVRNYTDVGHLVSDADIGEDKMEKGAVREGLSPTDIANKYIAIFEADNKDLNILEPDFKPKATEYIKEIQDFVQILLEKDFAYITDLAIYFDISKMKDYTKLSGQILEENKCGAGVGIIEDSQKRNPADFAIWFFRVGSHKNAIQYWPSPFTSPSVENGNGFPGWHIECSAMIKAILGNTIDIHMGGMEHISVHHTNEIAQSESANNAPLADYWLHNEWLMVDNGKMSKSARTAYCLAEVKEKGFNPLALRYFYLQAHYRSKQNFTWEALQSAETGYNRLVTSISALGTEFGEINSEFKERFISAISDDFNTAQALAIVFDILKSDLSPADKLATVKDFDRVLGLDLLLKKEITIPENIKEMVNERETARQNRDWKKSDELRNDILNLGYEVKDTDQGSEIIKLNN